MQRFGGIEKAQVTSLSTKLLAPVVQRLDITIQWISAHKTNHAIHWIVIYPGDSGIHLLDNPGLLRNMGNVLKSVIIYENVQMRVV